MIDANPLAQYRGQRVFLYFNLHKQCLSLKAMSGPNKGRVIGYATEVQLDDVELKVSQSGRNRVLEEKAKNVHAGLIGNLKSLTPWETKSPLGFKSLSDDERECGFISATYNPYKYNSFVLYPAETPVFKAKACLVRGRSIYLIP